MELHQTGLDSQHPVVEQLWAINKKGVAIQCSAHSPLAIIPILSDWGDVFDIIFCS